MRLKSALEALNIDLSLATHDELVNALTLLRNIQDLTPQAKETLAALYNHGPLFDGDLPSKTGRNQLSALGWSTRMVVKGELGHNCCTDAGAIAYRTLLAL